MKSANFRKAEPEDKELLLGWMQQLYENDGVPFKAEEAWRATLLLMGDARAGSIWIVERESDPVGYVVFTIGFSLELGGWHGFIDELFVASSERGAGLGSATIRHLASECARLGMTELLLEADLANEKATRLYYRLGFREHARRLMALRVGAGEG